MRLGGWRNDFDDCGKLASLGGEHENRPWSLQILSVRGWRRAGGTAGCLGY